MANPSPPVCFRDGRQVVRGNPAAREFERYARIVRAFAQEFGFTPSARARIEAPRPEEDEPEDVVIHEFDELIARAQAAQQARTRGFVSPP